MTTLENSVFVARSSNNGAPSNRLSSTAVFTPSSDGFKVSGARFYNFPNTTTVFAACGNCYTNANGYSKSSFFDKIRYTSVDGTYVRWGSRQDVFYDLDGSLGSNYFNAGSATSNFSSATLIPFYDFNNIAGRCFSSPSNNRWDQSLLCNKNTTVRGISLTNYIQSYSYSLLISRVDPLPNTLLSSVSTTFNSGGYSGLYSLPYVGGYNYRIQQEYLSNF